MSITADFDHALINLTQILDGIEGAVRALRDAANGSGYPSSASGSSGSRGATVLTRPEQIMERALAGQHDEADADLANLTRHAHRTLHHTQEALRVITRYQSAAPSRRRMGEECPEDWCVSCHRDHQHHSPITLRPSGEPYYVGLCRWCGDFKRAHKRLPSLEILQVRHQGRRVTMQMIDAQKPLKATKKGKGKR